MALSLVTAAATGPITTAEAKDHLRVDGTDEDTYIAALVSAATLWVEHTCGRALVSQTWDWSFDRFPSGGPLQLPKAPVSTITSITYLDEAGASTTWGSSNYVLGGNDWPARIALAPDASWPTLEAGRINAVTVRFVAGYGTASAVPEDIKHAVKLLVAQMYAHREPEITGTIITKVQFAVDALLAPYRLWSF